MSKPRVSELERSAYEILAFGFAFGIDFVVLRYGIGAPHTLSMAGAYLSAGICSTLSTLHKYGSRT